MDCSLPGSSVHGFFSRQNYWVGSHFLLQGIFLTRGVEPNLLLLFGCSSCPAHCDSMDCSMPGFPVVHYLPGFSQTHVHWTGDSIQPSHSLLLPSPALNFSQHQGLFQWVSFLHQVAKVLELQLQYPMNIQGWFLLGLTGWISLLSKGLSRVFFSTTVWRHQFFGTQPFLLSSSHICMWLLKKTTALTIWTFVSKVMSLLFNTMSTFVIAFLLRNSVL